MDDWDKTVLSVLTQVGGFTTGRVAQRIEQSLGLFGHNKRTHAAFIRQKLLALEKGGLVQRLDDQKPVCWLKSPQPDPPTQAGQL